MNAEIRPCTAAILCVRSRACCGERRPALAALVAGSRSGDDHAAARLAHDVLGHVAHEVLERATAPPEARAATDRGGLLGPQHDRLHPAPPRLLDDRIPRAARAYGGRRDMHPRV